MAGKKMSGEKSPITILKEFEKTISTFEVTDNQTRLFLMKDKCTGAHFCECHVKGSVLIDQSTTDAPLDPDDSEDYRANRDIAFNAAAFQKMKQDAINGRLFSNIVAEYAPGHGDNKPIKIIGGQHRYEAIKGALANNVDEYHGIKVYVGLTQKQRFDVQLISNTNIAVSPDLVDRMEETLYGSELRDWCQSVGFLKAGQDFTAKRTRGGPISVQQARTFIINYFKGKLIPDKAFNATETVPYLPVAGSGADREWTNIRSKFQKDAKLKEAAIEFVALAEAQRKSQFGRKAKGRLNYAEKAMSIAIIASWAFVAGVLHNNTSRLEKHFSIKNASGRDPLNSAAMAKARHKTDLDNYRGLGTRSGVNERGRLTEVFWYQADKGCGITPACLNIGIMQYHAKLAAIEVAKADRELTNEQH